MLFLNRDNLKVIFLTFFHKTYVVAIWLELSCVANFKGGGVQNQNCLLVIRKRTIIHQDLCLGKLVPSPHKRSKLSN